MAFYVTDHLGTEHKLDVPSEYTEEDFLDLLSDAHPDKFIPLALTAGYTIHIRDRFIASFARREPLTRYRPNDI